MGITVQEQELLIMVDFERMIRGEGGAETVGSLDLELGDLLHSGKMAIALLDPEGKVFRLLTPGSERYGKELVLSIEKAKLYEATKKRLDEVSILYEITKIATSSLGLDQMLADTATSLTSFFKLDALYFLLVDESIKRLSLHPSSLCSWIGQIEDLELLMQKGIPGWVAEREEPLWINDLRKDPRGFPGTDEMLSEMCVPIKLGGKLLGVIDARNKAANAFSENDFHLLRLAGEHLALLIDKVRSEERYRMVVEEVLDGVMVMGEDFRLIYGNEKLTEILGYSKDELTGMDFRHLLMEEDGDPISGQEGRRRKIDAMRFRGEKKIHRKDGEVRILEIRSTVMGESNGNGNIIAFVKDVTEKRKMEEQLLQAEKLRAIGEMASGVAHDFNNALAIILGNTQLMLLNAQDKEARETLRIIEKVAKDSAQTVRRLQEFTRNKVQQQLFKLDINAIMRDAIEITRHKWKDEAQGKGIHIEMIPKLEEVSPSAGNVSELMEVVANLIFNAIEAMPEGGKIELRTFQRKEKIYIQISDTGIGMTEEVRKRAFEPFFTTKPFTNSGLGLSMSYGIIRRFRGEIEVESRVGQGTIFTISLPVGSTSEEEKAAPVRVKHGGEARVLVIDDEELVRSVLFQTLSQANHRVTLANNGEEGIRLFKQEAFDVVLTDLGMPGMAGWEVCKTVKGISPRTQVGMITGWGLELDPGKIEESGLDFIIPKPFDFDKILNVVAEVMESRRSG